MCRNLYLILSEKLTPLRFSQCNFSIVGLEIVICSRSDFFRWNTPLLCLFFNHNIDLSISYLYQYLKGMDKEVQEEIEFITDMRVADIEVLF